MLGCYDFCGHYDWTFRWLVERGGKALLQQYWEEAVGGDSQKHAANLIETKGLAGMEEYWGHTLHEEAPTGGYDARTVDDRFLLEMMDCPSRSFLIRNGIEFSGDYCDHCIGWIGPVMKKAGFTVNHAHNHCGQCYWEYVPEKNVKQTNSSIEALKERLLREWEAAGMTIDLFEQKNDSRDKTVKKGRKKAE